MKICKYIVIYILIILFMYLGLEEIFFKKLNKVLL